MNRLSSTLISYAQIPKKTIILMSTSDGSVDVPTNVSIYIIQRRYSRRYGLSVRFRRRINYVLGCHYIAANTSVYNSYAIFGIESTTVKGGLNDGFVWYRMEINLGNLRTVSQHFTRV